MILGIASLLKVWITVVLSAGALITAIEVDSTSSPFKVNGERKPALAASLSHSYTGNVLYPSGLVRDRDQPVINSEEEVYVDEGPSPKDEDAEEDMKRSMGMLRLGRASSFDKRARSMAALRLGRSFPASAAERDALPNSWKRTMGMLRLGRRSDAEKDEDDEEEEEEEKRSMGMLRLGRRSQQHQQQQQQSEDSAAAAAADKRSMGMLRLGRSALHRMLSR